MKTNSLLSISMLFTFIFLISCCCSNKNQHKIKTLNSIGGEYEVEHTIIGDCVSKENHFVVAELTATEASVITAAYSDIIDTMKIFNGSSVSQVADPSNGYDAQGFVIDHGHSRIAPKYVKDVLRSTNYIVIGSCTNTSPKVGDIIVYEFKNLVVHSGKVVSVSAQDPDNPRIKSKWGAGPEYEHDFKNIPEDFNKKTYYRKESKCQPAN